MSDPTAVEATPTTFVNVHFERKMNLGNYNSCVASAYLSVPLESDNAAALTEALGDAFQQVKAAVYDELGIEVLVDESGVLREKHKPTVTVTEQRLGKELGATPVGGNFDTKGIEVANPDKMTEDIPDWLVSICEANGITKVWANQGRYGTFYKEFVSEGAEPKLGWEVKGDKKYTKIISKPK